MQIDRAAPWYGLCAVVGSASAWIAGSFGSVALIFILVACGLILANTGQRTQTLPIHHAVFGLAVSLAFGNGLSLLFHALQAGS